ncbi:MAG: aminoacetone oxidase family FAD-binding enzyme, partial [Lachnospiraceae bacterium]|nr:aminoacetone oxidase family FAD-binding enzyme [Lachnospiraceae bacterium]
MKTILIIGGGAAGLAAAVSASSGKRENRVILLEKNEKPGKKIYISGKGRCNLTNDQDMSVHMKNVVSNPRFLYSAYAAFSKEDIKRLLEENGCPVKTERGGRVFPVSDHASDVTKALVKAAEKNGVEMRLNTCVRELIVEDGVFRGVRTDDGILEADACIAATGGISYPSTGSTGDGYRFARTLGMKVSACYPSLVPMECGETWPGELSGLSLKNISVRFMDPSRPKKPLYEDFGELLFTHFGISGPVVLSASAYLT